MILMIFAFLIFHDFLDFGDFWDFWTKGKLPYLCATKTVRYQDCGGLILLLSSRSSMQLRFSSLLDESGMTSRKRGEAPQSW